MFSGSRCDSLVRSAASQLLSSAHCHSPLLLRPFDRNLPWSVQVRKSSKSEAQYISRIYPLSLTYTELTLPLVYRSLYRHQQELHKFLKLHIFLCSIVAFYFVKLTVVGTANTQLKRLDNNFAGKLCTCIISCSLELLTVLYNITMWFAEQAWSTTIHTRLVITAPQ